MEITASQVKTLRERTGAGMMDCKRALVAAAGDLEQAVEGMRKSGQAKADKKAGRITAEGIVIVRRSDDDTHGVLIEVNCETDFVAKEKEFRRFADAVAECVLVTNPPNLEVLADTPITANLPQIVEESRRDLIARIGENITVRRFGTVVAEDAGHVAGYVHGNRIGVLVAMTGGNTECARDIAMHVAAIAPIAIDASGISPAVLDRERSIIEAQIVNSNDSNKSSAIQEKILNGRLAKYLQEVTLLGQPFVKDPDISVKKKLQSANATVTCFERFEVGEGLQKRTENFVDEVMAQIR